jgi:hypothetical protein
LLPESCEAKDISSALPETSPELSPHCHRVIQRAAAPNCCEAIRGHHGPHGAQSSNTPRFLLYISIACPLGCSDAQTTTVTGQQVEQQIKQATARQKQHHG